jgi:hypothetical protein
MQVAFWQVLVSQSFAWQQLPLAHVPAQQTSSAAHERPLPQVGQHAVPWLHPEVLRLPSGMVVRQKTAPLRLACFRLAPARLASTRQVWLRLALLKLAFVAVTRLRLLPRKLLPERSFPLNADEPEKSQFAEFALLPMVQLRPL